MLDESERQVAAGDWNLRASTKIRPGETFLYDGDRFSRQEIDRGITYRTEISWDNVVC